MADTTTRALRADQSRMGRAFLAAVAISTFAALSLPAVAQVKAPSKNQLTAPAKAAPSSPTDNQADQLNEKWLSDFNKAAAANPSASPAGGDDERTSSVPSMATIPGAGARTVVTGSVKFVSAKSMAGFGTLAGGMGPDLKHLNEAFGGFAPASAKIDLLEGRTGDGATRLIYAGIGEGKARKSFWWFMPLDQPEGWFDETGKRLGGTALTDPKPGSRISSPFGTRRYYGRASGGGFHNGIDYEGKVGEPIVAAADGVINHQGWYFQYGRTVKISHADNFETLYAHMSRFENGVGPGSTVKKGDVVGYIGSTGRSTGPHLHFSVIVDGQFVDPQGYVSPDGGNNVLGGQSLVAYRKWQQDVRTASESQRSRARSESWSQNPFSGHN